MLRWLLRLVVVGLIGLGVAYAISRLMGQDEDFDDFDDIEAGFEFEETPVEIDVPVEAGSGEGSSAVSQGEGMSFSAGTDIEENRETATETGMGTDETSAARGKQTGILGSGTGGAADGSLIDINGIGPSYAARLEAAGITTIEDLANANAEDIASKMDVIGGSSAIEDWITQARDMTSGER
jgi:predicted flap endonuclease-1-like 5' DNA nuclease